MAYNYTVNFTGYEEIAAKTVEIGYCDVPFESLVNFCNNINDKFAFWFIALLIVNIFTLAAWNKINNNTKFLVLLFNFNMSAFYVIFYIMNMVG